MPKKIISKPVYWPDFEDLCKRLWAEVWQYPETKKNGRTGQPQYGVDIYGRPASGGYIGIQCKGKDEYSHQQLTVSEIDAEIAKAKLFQPKLSKFYFATTANRSSTIDTYIRQVDELHRNQGLFEVHVFYWEDIADLIEENKNTYDWYVLHQGFKHHTDACVRFNNDTGELTLRPRFIEDVTRYSNIEVLKMIDYRESLKKLKELGGPFYDKLKKVETFEAYVDFINTDTPDDYNVTEDPQPVEHYFRNFVIDAKRQNLSVCTIHLKLVNTGSTVLEDFKVYLNFNSVLTCDTVNKTTRVLDLNKYTYNVKFSAASPMQAVYYPMETVLVQNDEVYLDKLCFRTPAKPTVVTIDWKLVARGYQQSGQLKINVKPVIEKQYQAKWVADPANFTPKKITRNKYKY